MKRKKKEKNIKDSLNSQNVGLNYHFERGGGGGGRRGRRRGGSVVRGRRGRGGSRGRGGGA